MGLRSGGLGGGDGGVEGAAAVASRHLGKGQRLDARGMARGAELLEALGAELGISKERVRQIESRAIEKLKSALVSINPQMAAAC